MSDSVFEEEGAETSPTAAQQGDEGDKPESNSNPAEKGEQQPTQTHVGAGGILLQYFYSLFSVSCIFCSSQSAQLSLQWPENVCSGFFSRRRAPTAPCHRADRGGSPQSQNRRSADEWYHRGPVFTVLHRHAGEQCQCHQMFISSVQSRLKSEWIAYFLIQEKKLSSVTETN